MNLQSSKFTNRNMRNCNITSQANVEAPIERLFRLIPEVKMLDVKLLFLSRHTTSSTVVLWSLSTKDKQQIK